MDREIEKIIKNLEGNVLGIGLTKSMVEAIEKNNQILECNLLESYVQEQEGKKKKLKKIRIKKLNKYFRKKSIDTILCKYDLIQKYMNTFVKNSVYINRKKLYFFGVLDKELIERRYQRYQTKVTFIDIKDESIAIIDNEYTKNHRIKELGYRVFDSIIHAIDVIGDVLMN